MKKLFQVIEVDYKKLTKEDWDSVLIIAGDEGTGKSQIGLHIIDFWYSKLRGECLEKDIDSCSLNMRQFVNALKTKERFEINVYDEAGELSNLRRVSKFNVAVNLAYQIIRGRNIMTILILPSLFDLDGFFTKRRARGFIQVERRGKFAFYSKKKLREIMDRYQRKKNQYAALRSVRPLFRDTFDIYRGVLYDGYKAKKEARMKEVINLLEERLEGMEGVNDVEKGENDSDLVISSDIIDLVNREQQHNYRD